MRKQSLVIMAAGTVNSNLNGDLGKILTSHIPISGKMALVQIIKKSRELYNNIYVNLDESTSEYMQFLNKSEDVQILVGNKNDTLDKSIEKILSDLPLNLDSVDILFGDSWNSDLISSISEGNDVIYVTPSTDSNLFTSIIRDSETKSLTITTSPRTGNLSMQITGSFKISNLHLFRQIYKTNSREKNTSTFWETLIDYDHAMNNSVQLITDISWSDIGHVDNYFKARREHLKSASRYFNNVSIDLGSGLLKKSGPSEKIELEKDWYLKIPIHIQKYVPLVNIGGKRGQYMLEYLTSIPLNEMWISENNDMSYWQSFVLHMKRMMEDLHDSTYSTSDSLREIRKSKEEIYINKFNKRIESFLKNNRNFNLSNIKINGKNIPKLEIILEEILKVSNRIIAQKHWSIIHGDLCFSNIIFDRRKDRIFLIDPRGNFGDDGIFGDPIYDLCKLSHSVFGNYDYFASNLFTVKKDAASYSISTAAPKEISFSRSVCQDLLMTEIKKYEIDFGDLRILESSLFLAAADLHNDGPRGQALFLQGLLISSEVLSC
jgi:hypothetical protein